jgi:hypothetical protein
VDLIVNIKICGAHKEKEKETVENLQRTGQDFFLFDCYICVNLYINTIEIIV